MPYTFRERFGYWLERFAFLNRLTMRPDGIAPNGCPRYVNRVNRHVVIGAKRVSR